MARNCKNGWLKTYLDYVGNLEVPWEFHMWSGISVLAATLGRSVYMSFDYFSVYPNLYVILVAPSGIKKSTAADQAMQIFRAANLGETNIIDGKVTMPKLLRELGDSWNSTGESKAFIWASEYKSFTSAAESGGSSLLADMTTLWDCPSNFSYRTKAEGLVTLDNVCINMLGCSTPEWLVSSAGKDFINSGFSARNLFVYKEACDKREALPEKPPGWQQMQADLVHDLQEIQTLHGEVTLSQGAKDFYKRWYDDRNNFLVKDEKLQSYMNRKHTYVLKLSMILRFQREDSLVVEEKDIRAAIKAVDSLEASVEGAYSGIGYHEQDEVRLRVLAQLKKSGLMSKKQLIRANQTRLKVREIEEVLYNMEQSGEIMSNMVRRGTKTTPVYYLNPHMNEDDFDTKLVSIGGKRNG